MKHYHIIISAAILLVIYSCVGDRNKHGLAPQKTLTVSILPLKYIVDEISGHDYKVNVLVPPGSSPETYEPTPKQLSIASQSNSVFTIGLIDFEVELSKKLQDTKIVETYHGIAVKQGVCGHKSHSHGVDPHIWLTMDNIRVIATNVCETLCEITPDSTIKYTKNFNDFKVRLEGCNDIINQLTTNVKNKSFLIYHPALSYYADQYGLTQISVEEDGKEPSISSLKNIIDYAHQSNINKILYQKGFNLAYIKSAVQDSEIECIEIDPLKENLIDNILDITRIITDRNED